MSFEKGPLHNRASELQRSIRPGLSNYKIEGGQVILLDCPPHELRRRLISKNKFWNEDVIASNVASLRKLYSNETLLIDTYAAGVDVTAKNISRLIFQQPYRPVDLDHVLVNQLS